MFLDGVAVWRIPSGPLSDSASSARTLPLKSEDNSCFVF